MSIYLLETWIIKPEDEEEHKLLWENYVDYMNKNPKLFSGIKSMRLCNKLPGNNLVTHTQIVEFDSLEDKELLDNKLSKDSKSIEFHQKVRNGYLAMAEKYPEKIKVVKVEGNIESTYGIDYGYAVEIMLF